MAMIEKLIVHNIRGNIEAVCDSDTGLKGIRKWLYQKYATREMLVGLNANLLLDIRAVMRRLP